MNIKKNRFMTALEGGRYDEAMRVLREKIEETGACVISITDVVPPFTYTAGVFDTYGFPELVMFGIDGRTACLVINNILDRLKEGDRPDLSTPLDRLLEHGYQIVLEPIICPDIVLSKMRVAQFFYNNEIPPVALICWPDQFGRFAWEDDFQLRNDPLYSTTTGITARY
ncbi:MAG: DUF4262 domain-containing protein [Cyanobacteria bacterium P01_H01_bin.121]